MSNPVWPSELPCGLIEGTAASIDAGVARVRFEGGNTRQRRVHRSLAHTYSVAWIVKQAPDYTRFLAWVNQYGFGWFDMPLASEVAAKQKATLHTVRITSPLQTELLNTRNGFFWRISATVLWMPNGALDNIPVPVPDTHLFMKDWVPLSSPYATPIGRKFK